MYVAARKSREKQLRKELSALKRQIKLRDKANDPSKPRLHLETNCLIMFIRCS